MYLEYPLDIISAIWKNHMKLTFSRLDQILPFVPCDLASQPDPQLQGNPVLKTETLCLHVAAWRLSG